MVVVTINILENPQQSKEVHQQVEKLVLLLPEEREDYVEERKPKPVQRTIRLTSKLHYILFQLFCACVDVQFLEKFNNAILFVIVNKMGKCR